MENDLTKYYEVRDRMAVGDGISWEGSGIISGGIAIWSHRTHWSNVGQWVKFKAQGPRLPIFEAWEGEYNIRSLGQRLKYYDGKAYWHPLKYELRGYRDAMHRKMWDMVGVPYDYSALFANMWGRQPIDDEALFCSEAGGIAVLEIDHDMLGRYAPNKYLEYLLADTALRPGGMALLPVWKPEVRLI